MNSLTIVSERYYYQLANASGVFVNFPFNILKVFTFSFRPLTPWSYVSVEYVCSEQVYVNISVS